MSSTTTARETLFLFLFLLCCSAKPLLGHHALVWLLGVVGMGCGGGRGGGVYWLLEVPEGIRMLQFRRTLYVVQLSITVKRFQWPRFLHVRRSPDYTVCTIESCSMCSIFCICLRLVSVVNH